MPFMQRTSTEWHDKNERHNDDYYFRIWKGFIQCFSTLGLDISEWRTFSQSLYISIYASHVYCYELLRRSFRPPVFHDLYYIWERESKIIFTKTKCNAFNSMVLLFAFFILSMLIFTSSFEPFHWMVYEHSNLYLDYIERWLEIKELCFFFIQ